MTRVFKRVLALFTLIGIELIILGIVGLACVFLFLLMAKVVFIDQNYEFDAAVFEFAKSHTTASFTSFMKFVTFFASKDFLVYSSIGLAIIFYFFKKHRWYMVKVPVIAAGSSVLNQALKGWFNRPRPETAFYEQNGLSFPSGHAMIGAAFYGLLIYLIWTSIENKFWKKVWTGLLIIWILLIGYSRVYLNVHYASDVLAGWAGGFVFLIITLFILQKLEPKYAQKANEIITESEQSDNKN